MKFNKINFVFTFLIGPFLFFSFILIAQLITFPFTYETKLLIETKNNEETNETKFYLTAICNQFIKNKINQNVITLCFEDHQNKIILANQWINDYNLVIAENDYEEFDWHADSSITIQFGSQNLWQFIINHFFN